MGYVIGVDLGGTKMRAGIASSDGVVLHELTAATPSRGGLAEALLDLIGALRAVAGIQPSDVDATAIGAAGVPAADGTLALAPNLTEAARTSLVDEIAGSLGHRVLLDNDVNVAALGELAEGVGREYDDFVVIAVGTGIGMGIISGRRLVRGFRGAAGEIGYLPFGSDPLEPRNHRRGPLEEAVAGDVLGGRLRDESGASIGAECIFERAATGVPRAVQAVDDEARWVAAASVAVSAVLDPAAIVLSGGIGARPEMLARVRTWLPRYGVRQLEVRASDLGGRAPVIGAVHLALSSASSVSTP